MALTLRKFDKQELQSKIDTELMFYQHRLTTHGDDVEYPVDAKGNYRRSLIHGGVEKIFESTLARAITALQDKLAQGYTSIVSMKFCPEVDIHGNTSLYVVKPYSPAEGTARVAGVSYQIDDIDAITKRITEAYNASIEAHNDKVYQQEAKALAEEEARVAAQLKAEDAAREAAEFDKRVRERMRGLKGAK